jgi:alginate O-acetyltransferase complex protein AlgJ
MRLVTVFFLIAISMPLAANLAGMDGADAAAENRELAHPPHFDGSWQSAARFGGALSAWFGDHFGFRSTLVRWYGQTRLYVLGVSPSTAVVKGKNGWFFYVDDEALTDFTRQRPLTTPEVKLWRDAAVRTRDWLDAQGIGYVVMIAPDKHAIYPDEMPSGARAVAAVSRSDQVIEALRDAGVATVDPRAALIAASGRERVYHKTDTHWNHRGAHVAYQQLIAAIRAQVPEVPEAWGRDDFDAVAVERDGMDLARMMGLSRVIHEVDLQLAPKRPRRARVAEPEGVTLDDETARIVSTLPGSALPTAVMFRDSFFSQLAPFVAEHFGRAVLVWQNDFDPDVVAQERPAIVIQEIVGRHLYTFLPTPDLVPR